MSDPTPLPTDAADQDGYDRTGNGYIRADGEERVCVRFYLTRPQARAIKARVAEADLSAEHHVTQSEWLVGALGLGEPSAGDGGEEIDYPVRQAA